MPVLRQEITGVLALVPAPRQRAPGAPRIGATKPAEAGLDVHPAQYRRGRGQADRSLREGQIPYKTNISATIAINGKGGVMDKPVALYLQLGVEAFVAAGRYMMPPE